jgi:HD-GYP domain-containing protein (c-di-GMP phosphodiesterase class II)
MNLIESIYNQIEVETQTESIQQLVKDLHSTQHGDRTNPAYQLFKDYHKEGSVWKHTRLAIESLPEISKALSEAFQDPDYERLYGDFIHVLRTAALYHDIGKITTQKPSTSRTGSFSFPEHQKEEIVDKLFAQYDIEPLESVKLLVVHHHDSPEDFKKLDWNSDMKKLLIILKAADNFAVGPTDIASAVEHVRPFVT